MIDADPPPVDGRTARGERTRRAIVEAHYALLNEGDLKPTGARIAERAGVSLRAVWTNFKDMETLFAAAGELIMQVQDEAYRPVRADLPLAGRLDEFCRQRMRMLEIIAPSARASQIREPFSPQLRRNRAKNIARVRAEIEEVFAPELAAAGAAREQLLHALTAATTWATWSMLRDVLELGPEQARQVMARTVGALLHAATDPP